MSATSTVCAIVRSGFEGYLRDSLAAPQRRMLRDHLSSCAACRDAAAALDPTLLFARPIRDEIPEEDGRRILAAVRTGVELMETERRIGGRSRRRLLAPAAAAAVAALALLSPGRDARSARPIPAGSPSEASASARPLDSPPLPSATATDGLQPAGLAAETAPPTSAATIYDWNPGAGREEPRVVWIVDRGLDI